MSILLVEIGEMDLWQWTMSQERDFIKLSQDSIWTSKLEIFSQTIFPQMCRSLAFVHSRRVLHLGLSLRSFVVIKSGENLPNLSTNIMKNDTTNTAATNDGGKFHQRVLVKLSEFGTAQELPPKKEPTNEESKKLSRFFEKKKGSFLYF